MAIVMLCGSGRTPSPRPGQQAGLVELPDRDRVEDGVDHRPGAAGQQGTESQVRVTEAAVVAALFRVAGQDRGCVGERQHGSVDRGQQQAPPADRSGGARRGGAAQQVEQRPQWGRAESLPGLANALEVGAVRASPARPAVSCCYTWQ